jgi:hypothetical protein
MVGKPQVSVGAKGNELRHAVFEGDWNRCDGIAAAILNFNPRALFLGNPEVVIRSDRNANRHTVLVLNDITCRCALCAGVYDAIAIGVGKPDAAIRQGDEMLWPAPKGLEFEFIHVCRAGDVDSGADEREQERDDYNKPAMTEETLPRLWDLIKECGDCNKRCGDSYDEGNNSNKANNIHLLTLPSRPRGHRADAQSRRRR